MFTAQPTTKSSILPLPRQILISTVICNMELPFNPDSFREGRLRSLPGGISFCSHIQRAIEHQPETRSDIDSCWLRIAETAHYCQHFPAAEFEVLKKSSDFDVRWPLTFACHYLLITGASVDHECMEFLNNSRLDVEVIACLPEFIGDHVSAWRERFEYNLTKP